MTDDLVNIRPLGECPHCGEPLYKCPECDRLVLALARCHDCGYIVGEDCLRNGLCDVCLENHASYGQADGFLSF